VYFAAQADELAVFGVVVAAVASLMVSYTRARAEALGVECKVGFGNRAARVAILSAGILLVGVGVDEALEAAVYVLAVLGTITFLQRIFHVRGQLNRPVAGESITPVADEAA
jgi:CDP-diacylglycerol--glycerol-3-phosphate 3-phosphatidyltransferase